MHEAEEAEMFVLAAFTEKSKADTVYPLATLMFTDVWRSDVLHIDDSTSWKRVNQSVLCRQDRNLSKFEGSYLL